MLKLKFFCRCSLLNYLNSIAVVIDCIHCFSYLKMLLVVSLSKLLKLHERLQLMSLAFYHTLTNFFLSSLFSIQASLNFQLFLSSGLIISQSLKLLFQQFQKPLLLYYPAKSLLMDRKLVLVSQHQPKAGQVSVQLIASLWQVYKIQLSRYPNQSIKSNVFSGYNYIHFTQVYLHDILLIVSKV